MKSLCLWLIDNYIRQFADQCPHHISRLLHKRPNNLNQTLPRALSLITEWRRSRLDEISYSDFQEACANLSACCFQIFSPSAGNRLLCKYIIEHLLEIDSRLLPYYYAACFLKVSSLLERGQEAVQVADVNTDNDSIRLLFFSLMMIQR
jgi:hypothetical protein